MYNVLYEFVEIKLDKVLYMLVLIMFFSSFLTSTIIRT